MTSLRLAFALGLALASATVPAQQASLQDAAKALDAEAEIVIYPAREVVTLDGARPVARAVAVTGDRIVATGSIEELQAAAGPRGRIDETFLDRVIVPGFIAQHDHPALAALTLTSEIIAIEDWVLPGGTIPAARGRDDYLRRVAEAQRAITDPAEALVTWGYHRTFHGPLAKADLDAISGTRPIIVWHRSAHEFYVNSAAERAFGIDRVWFDALDESVRRQADFAHGTARHRPFPVTAR